MKIYRGYRDNFGAQVAILESGRIVRALPLRLDLYNHSPTGFEWGYGGSGPAQLALALLADVLGDERRAIKLHQKFKWKVIAALNRDIGTRTDQWELTDVDVLDFVEGIERCEN